MPDKPAPAVLAAFSPPFTEPPKSSQRCPRKAERGSPKHFCRYDGVRRQPAIRKFGDPVGVQIKVAAVFGAGSMENALKPNPIAASCVGPERGDACGIACGNKNAERRTIRQDSEPNAIWPG